MDAYWSEGQDIGDVEVLRRARRRSSSCRPTTSKRCSRASATATGSRARRAQAVSIGANAVPAFLLDRRLLVLGAQPEELFEQAFEQLAEIGLSVRFVDELDDGFGWQETARDASHVARARGGWASLGDRSDRGRGRRGADPRARRAGGRDPAPRPARPGVRGVRGAARRAPARGAGRAAGHAVRGPARAAEPVLGARSRSGGRSGAILVCADALGTLPYFRAGDEPVGVHPFLRLRPPRVAARAAAGAPARGSRRGAARAGAAAAVEDALRTGAAAAAALGRRASRRWSGER